MNRKAKDFSSIVVLTGAGISAESGLKTFRDNGGLWEEQPVEEVATPEAFARNPEKVHRFYNLRREQLLAGTLANKAHSALGQFEKQFRGEFLVVTQNVDNLHEQGGSESLIHMHGELLKVRCQACFTILNWQEDLKTNTVSPCCHTPGSLRPHIVWFGEVPLHMDRIGDALTRCDLFVSIGTSGNVYPAAGFVELARTTGAHCVELNLEASAGASLFHEHRYGPAGETIPEYFSP